MKTHRCEGVLKNKTPIRKCYKDWIHKYDDWSLFNITLDHEYDCWHTEFVSKIIYCPYCGVYLKGSENNDQMD